MLLVSFFNGPKSHYLHDFTLKLLYICNSSWTRSYWCHTLLLNSLMRVGYGEYSLLILMPSSFVWVLHQPETETKHHRLCHRVDQILRCSAPRPRCCSECAQLPLQFPSLCPSEHSSTHPSLTLGLRLSSSGRILIFCGMWLQTLCWFPFPWPSWLSGGAVDLLLNTEHTKKQWGTRWLKKCNWWSQQPFLEESLGRLTGSLSLHGFVLGKNKRVLCDLRHKALG